MHVFFPVFPLLDIRHAEFPVLFRVVDALDEALLLLFLRKMQDELDDPGSFAVEMLFQIRIERNRSSTRFSVEQLIRDVWRGEFDARARSAISCRSAEDADPARSGGIDWRQKTVISSVALRRPAEHRYLAG
jgi:hypothetical protein